jgi:hypothetical protein
MQWGQLRGSSKSAKSILSRSNNVIIKEHKLRNMIKRTHFVFKAVSVPTNSVNTLSPPSRRTIFARSAVIGNKNISGYLPGSRSPTVFIEEQQNLEATKTWVSKSSSRWSLLLRKATALKQEHSSKGLEGRNDWHRWGRSCLLAGISTRNAIPKETEDAFSLDPGMVCTETAGWRRLAFGRFSLWILCGSPAVLIYVCMAFFSNFRILADFWILPNPFQFTCHALNQRHCVLCLLSHVWMTIDGVWISNLTYWTHTDRYSKWLQRCR